MKCYFFSRRLTAPVKTHVNSFLYPRTVSQVYIRSSQKQYFTSNNFDERYGLPSWTFLCIRKKCKGSYLSTRNIGEYVLGARRLQWPVSHYFCVKGGGRRVVANYHFFCSARLLPIQPRCSPLLAVLLVQSEHRQYHTHLNRPQGHQQYQLLEQDFLHPAQRQRWSHCLSCSRSELQ